MRCRFCFVDEERQHVIWQGQHVFLLISNPEIQVDMHMLVIPCRHVEHLWDLTPEERQEFFDTWIWVQQKIIKSVFDY